MTENRSRRFPVRWLLLAGFVLVATAVGLMVRHQVQKAEEEATRNAEEEAVRKAELVAVRMVEQLGGHVQTYHSGLVVALHLADTNVTVTVPILPQVRAAIGG